MIFSRRFSFVLLAVGLLLKSPAAVGAQAFIIVDSQTGYILQELKSKDKRQIGSVTKIATACVVLDWAEHKGGDLNQSVIISSQAFAGMRENNIGFQPGDEVTLRDLLYAALVQSDNIAAYTVADYVGSIVAPETPTTSGPKPTGIDAFVTQMNALAKELNMQHTRFVNPHGIDENVKPLPFSTAEDIARLTRYAMNKASFRFYVSQKEREITFHRGKRELRYLLRNTNELLGTRGIDGVKTGTTRLGGECLVLSANRDSEVVNEARGVRIYPRHLVVVLLGSTNRFAEGAQLLERGWQLYDQWAAAGRPAPADPKRML
ncbi:MAG TPA: serine hydrolase [Chthoniobacterales bacterium]|nr:serine hydrolase [Chthoniobacterales bacterium]